VVVIVLVPLEPRDTIRLEGWARIEKSFFPPDTDFTVKVTVVVWVADAPVPVTVIVDAAVGVESEVVIVSVELPPAVTLVGLNEALAPLGSPLALKETDWAEPLVNAVEIVLVPLEP
jgi:hypothetical protein